MLTPILVIGFTELGWRLEAESPVTSVLSYCPKFESCGLWMWECLPLPSKLLVMKVKLYQIIEDNSAELHSMHSVNGSWFGPQKIEDDSAVFVCFYKIVPRLFWSCHETDTDEWREGCWLVSISSDSILKPPGRILCLVRAGISNQISSLHFFKNQFCRRRDFLAWSTALKYGDMDWFWFILCPATCRALQSITTVWRKFLASL